MRLIRSSSVFGHDCSLCPRGLFGRRFFGGVRYSHNLRTKRVILLDLVDIVSVVDVVDILDTVDNIYIIYNLYSLYS